MSSKTIHKTALSKSIFVANLVLAGTALTLSSGMANAAAVPIDEEPVVTEIEVSGFKSSLTAARELKRSMVHQTDSIVAEDIGKMPDLNLAESLQRVPGVAITREGGEGRNITVRGLGPGFTRTTLNGMEVPAGTGGLDSSGGVNRGRDFDFNVFGSELFNRITINKSAIAHIEEGGLASTVELYSRKPFDNPGRIISISAQGSYNLDSEELDPRYTAVFSQTFADDTFGVLASYTTSDRTVNQEGAGTVRWTSPFDNGGRSWVGTDADVIINGTPNPAGNYPDETIDQTQQLDYLWHPRLPRMDSFNREQERTGYTLALQWRPAEKLEFGFDLVGSELDADVSSYNYFAQFRNLQDDLAPVEVTLDPSGRLITAGTFDNVQPRSESRGQFSETDFLQTVFSVRYDLTDNITVRAMYGNAESEHHEEQYRLNLTAIDGHMFDYSFASDSDIPEMSYGFDIFDVSEYEFTGPVFRLDEVNKENDTFRLDFDINGDTSIVRTGVIWNKRTTDSLRGDPININDTSSIVVDSSNTSRLSQEVDNFGDIIDPPSGFPTDWLVANFGAAIEQFNAGQFEIVQDDSATFDIEEETLGGYIEADVEATLLGRPLTINAGIRVVKTELTSKGVASDGLGSFVPTVFEQEYTEYLPAVNLAWEFVEDALFRLSMGRNLSRPGLGSLVGTVDVTPINGNVSLGNPDLEPIRANSIDAGFEWYFADDSLVSITFFHKDIESFITGDTLENQTLPADIQAIVAARPEYDPSNPLFDPSLLSPSGADWNITTSVNGEGAELDGYEIGYQHALDFLFPGVGVFANYTYVDSEAEFGNGVVGSLEGLSEDSYNLGVYYENDTFGARVVLNDRDDYVTDQTGSNGNASHATTGPTRVDMSAFWNITDNFTATLEVINLTNEEERLYTTGPLGDQDLVREFNSTGTEVLLGIRASF